MSLKNICKQGIGIGLTLLLESGCATTSNVRGYAKSNAERQAGKNRECEERLGVFTLFNFKGNNYFKDNSYITTPLGCKELMTILGVYTKAVELRMKEFTITAAYSPYVRFSPEPCNDALKRMLLEADEDKDHILTSEEISTLKNNGEQNEQ
ncbi:MAG: hypothetical protein WC595_05895 [Candidatus Nanoarchaeia archaeon]